ncbi:MAG: Ig-like domain-containing protein [Lachnospiraceae bacterium]|nr:Ig-like domain-containing protein [Lachnospiraceae bacterium]
MKKNGFVFLWLHMVLLVFCVVISIIGSTEKVSAISGTASEVDLNRTYLICDLEYDYAIDIEVPEAGRICIEISDNNEEIHIYDKGPLYYDNELDPCFYIKTTNGLSTGWISVSAGAYYIPLQFWPYDPSDSATILVRYQSGSEYHGETETNDSYETSNVIQSGVSYEGNFLYWNDNMDVYKFELSETAAVSITLTTQYNLDKNGTESENGYTFALEKEESNGNTSSIGAGSSGKWRLSAGTYYIVLYSESWGQYTLKAEILHESSDSNEQEDNDTKSTANIIQLNTTYTGNLNDSNDVDYYTFTVSSLSKIQLKCTVPVSSGSQNLRFTLYKSSSSSLYTDNASGTSTSLESDQYEVSAGTYYLKVDCSSSYDSATTEDYSFMISCPVSVKLNKTKATATVGDTIALQLTATVYGSKASVKWTSSKKSVATVSSSGKITVKKAGKTTITATVAGKTAKCVVTVKKKTGWKSAYNKVIKNWKSTIKKYSNQDYSYLSQYFGKKFKYNKYFLYDLDGNGVPELFLYSTSMKLTAVFTYKNDKLVSLGYQYFYAINTSKKALLVHGHWHGAGGSGTYEYSAYKISGSKLKEILDIDITGDYYCWYKGKTLSATYKNYYTYYEMYFESGANVVKFSKVQKYNLSKKIK